MTTPAVFASHLASTNTDENFLRCKVDRSGALRTKYFSITVPDNTSAGTIMAIEAFRKGASVNLGATKIYVSDLDTASNVTINYGYVYDDHSNNTNDTDAFGSAITTGQSAGYVTFDEEEGLDFVATADGYVVAEFAAGPVSTAGTMEGQIAIFYDGV